MIELKNLSKVYKTSEKEIVALDGINLTIQDGEIFGIIGLSGAGKSTLVRCINLLERPTGGEVIQPSGAAQCYKEHLLPAGACGGQEGGRAGARSGASEAGRT